MFHPDKNVWLSASQQPTINSFLSFFKEKFECIIMSEPIAMLHNVIKIKHFIFNDNAMLCFVSVAMFLSLLSLWPPCAHVLDRPVSIATWCACLQWYIPPGGKRTEGNWTPEQARHTYAALERVCVCLNVWMHMCCVCFSVYVCVCVCISACVRVCDACVTV